MAGESAMQTNHALRMLRVDESWPSFVLPSEQRMLSNLGITLRDVYTDITEADQPSDLLRLAAMIDEQRGTRTS